MSTHRMPHLATRLQPFPFSDQKGRPGRTVPAPRTFVRRWVIAFILGEIVGFGGAAGVGGGIASVFGSRDGLIAAVAMVVATIGAGAIEGAAVGWAQWRACRQVLPALTSQAWVLATASGAVLAWSVGMVIGSLAAPAEDPGLLAVTVAAALLGALAGAILGGAQWVVLRQHVQRHAGWWIGANATGWMVGMVVAFAGIGAVPEGAAVGIYLVVGIITGAAMAIIPALVTGWTLITLVDANVD